MKAITLKHAHDAHHRGLNQTIAIALNNRVLQYPRTGRT